MPFWKLALLCANMSVATMALFVFLVPEVAAELQVREVALVLAWISFASGMVIVR